MTALDGVRVNIGCGPQAADGWVNIDGSWQAWLASRPRLARIVSVLTQREVGRWSPAIRCHDVRRHLPFADAAVSVVFASHVVEHLTRDEAVRLLREARRVLRPGGVCRIIVPDVAAVMHEYQRERDAGVADSSDRLMERLHVRDRGARARNPLLRWYRGWTEFDLHKWMYDGLGACRLLQEAGFSRPSVREFLDSDIPSEWLRLVERPDRVLNGAGVCVEARAGDAAAS